MVQTVKLGTPYVRGNNEEITNRVCLVPNGIDEGTAVMLTNVSGVDQIVQADGSKPAYGIAAVYDSSKCQSVVVKGMRVAIQLEIGATVTVGATAYVAASGKITDDGTLGCVIGTFADTLSGPNLVGVTSNGDVRLVCAYIDVDPAKVLIPSSVPPAFASVSSKKANTTENKL